MGFHQRLLQDCGNDEGARTRAVGIVVTCLYSLGAFLVILVWEKWRRGAGGDAMGGAAGAGAGARAAAEAEPYPEPVQYDQSRLAKDANLAPFLLLSERMLILETIFHQQQEQEQRGKNHRVSFDGTKSNRHEDYDAGVDLEVAAAADNVTDFKAHNSPSAALNQESYDLLTMVATITGWIFSRQQQQQQPEQGTNGAREPEEARERGPAVNAECCICFAAFDEEEDETSHGPEEATDRVENQPVLVSGTACQHLFHYDCLMLWLQEHNACPYCQADMVSVDEFRQAAVETLGDNRILELATLAQTASATVP